MQELEKEFIEVLIQAAINAREKAYAPYSDFKVGAAVATTDGKVYSGCNVENASYGITCCAERVALFKAVSEGSKIFKAVAIVYDKDKNLARPCGACRQAILEFGDNIPIIMANLEKKYEIEIISKLLPNSF